MSVNANYKDPLRVSISDPMTGGTGCGGGDGRVSPRGRDRRARWIYQNKGSPRMQHKEHRSLRSRKSNGGNERGDSGFGDIQHQHHHGRQISHASSPYLYNESETTMSIDSPIVNNQSKWEYGGLLKSGRLGCSLPPLEYTQQDLEEEEEDSPGAAQHYLSRQGGVRYSLHCRRGLSPSSISSESEASQEGCENALNPSGALLLPSSVGGRKQSVLFSSYNEAWGESAMAQSFREMSPSQGAALEAAWSGNSESLEGFLSEEGIMEKFKEGNLRDGAGRTPLHLAAACGHLETVAMLLDKGAPVNEYDNQNSTPLSCAASCGSLTVVELLLKHGADVNSGYDFGKTALHWAVQAGSFSCAKKLLEMGALQNPPQIYSETPLHVAAALGDTECLQLLLDYKADPSLCKGTNRSTAMHLAAEEANSACLKLLLKGGASHEAKDLRGHTALHIAATCDADCVQTLLKGGANPNTQDGNGRTPLHCAVSRGSRAAECVRQLVVNGAEIDAQDTFGYTPLHLAAVNESSQCASILLSHGADVTAKTKAGTTALALLVRKIPDVMRYLVDRLDSAVTIHDHDPADPDCEIRLDFRGIVPHVMDRNKGGTGGSSFQQGKDDHHDSYYDKPRKETEFLTCVLAAGNKKILAHPLSEAFLTLKWQRVRKFFWASLLFQIALVALFTIFVVQVYLIDCPNLRGHVKMKEQESEPTIILETPLVDTPGGILLPPDNEPGGNFSSPFKAPENQNGTSFVRRKRDSGFSWFSVRPERKKQNKTTKRPDKIERGQWRGRSEMGNPRVRIGGGGSGLNIPPPNTEPSLDDDEVGVDKEPMMEECKLEPWLWIIWCLLVSLAGIMAMKEIFQLLQSPCSYILSSENWGQWALIASVGITAWDLPDYTKHYWQYPAASLGIFLAWGLMLLQVGRFPALGLYVQMLGKVAANFGLFILAYACLLIAFALAFCVLFPESPIYSSPPKAMLKVLTMMVGEVDYEGLFYSEKYKDDPILYHMAAHFLHGAFVIIVTIVLMNLLVGLAVHDIQGLQKGAKLNRLSRQTALISRLESFIFSKRLQSCLPRSVGSILQKSALLVPSSYNWSYYFRPNDPRDLRLPKDLKQAALRLAASKHSSSRTIRGHPGGVDPRHNKDNGIVNHSGSSRLNLLKAINNNNGSSSNGESTGANRPSLLKTNDYKLIELRLDKFQLQLDTLTKNINEKLELLLTKSKIQDETKKNVRSLSNCERPKINQLET